MEREQIIKALECCKTPSANDCEACGYTGKCLKNAEYLGCVNLLIADALALIKELTEENERLRADCAKGANALIEEIQKNRTIEAETVRKMQERLKERKVSYGNITFRVVPIDEINQIAKEMLEDK